MPIAKTLKRYLDNSGIAYETVAHPFSTSSQKTAQLAHVSGKCLAKGVLLGDERGYLLAVLPSPLHIELETLNELFDRNFELVEEDEISRIFSDCDIGAIPPVGDAYKLEVALDTQLCNEPAIYFEAGDHVELILVGGSDFQKLLKGAERFCFAR